MRNAVEAAPAGTQSAPARGEGMVSRLRSMAFRGLARMYRPDERLFVFRVRRGPEGIVRRGLSRRYTAIALIGLAGEGGRAVASVLGSHHLHDVCGRLMGDVARVDNVGDVALILWAGAAVDYPERRWAWERLIELRPAEGVQPVVELAWALAALCRDAEAPVGDLRELLARRLLSSFTIASGMFPHIAGGNGAGLRSHVSCFADLAYPIHALTNYFTLSGDREALDRAIRCAEQVCRLQGPAGQWWWHYDRRSGRVIEGYPVYAVHQDAMAPMALLALQDVAGGDFASGVEKGLAWLERAPELDGRSLIDDREDMIWRKVARREPRKLSRILQAAASRVHPVLRAPGLDAFFPARAVDYEDRPYHLGWLLYAWPAARVARWEGWEETR